MIKRILIANRGEIAVRIIRACKELGITTVIAHSACDKDTMAVFMADESVCIGGNSPSDSYLKMNNILQAAKNYKCDAIHPGYGFLSEDFSFASEATKSGIVFIGPSPKVLNLTTDKQKVKQVAEKLGIPVIPKAKPTDDYPLYLKSNFGGGGKGIRLLQNSEEYKRQIKEAAREVDSGFTKNKLFLEKAVDVYKHIDIQFISDAKRNITILPARDCSVQNNYQKFIEETPAASVPRNLVSKMKEDTEKLVSEIEYDSIGTVEFLVDKNNNYYFLEINSRLQVEHTITEEVTGIDLVKAQILIADNTINRLPAKIEANCHSIECRILAKTSGCLNIYNLPSGKDIRLDTYIYQGYEMKPFYDPLMIKLITKASSRSNAIAKMKLALDEMIISGVETNIDDDWNIVSSKEYSDGSYSIFRREP